MFFLLPGLNLANPCNACIRCQCRWEDLFIKSGVKAIFLPVEKLIFLICFHFSASSQRQQELSAFLVCAESTMQFQLRSQQTTLPIFRHRDLFLRKKIGSRDISVPKLFETLLLCKHSIAIKVGCVLFSYVFFLASQHLLNIRVGFKCWHQTQAQLYIDLKK